MIEVQCNYRKEYTSMIAIAILFLASVIPPVYLAKKIYAMDRIEPEPRRLIRKLVLCGALACRQSFWNIWGNMFSASLSGI